MVVAEFSQAARFGTVTQGVPNTPRALITQRENALQVALVGPFPLGHFAGKRRRRPGRGHHPLTGQVHRQRRDGRAIGRSPRFQRTRVPAQDVSNRRLSHLGVRIRESGCSVEVWISDSKNGTNAKLRVPSCTPRLRSRMFARRRKSAQPERPAVPRPGFCTRRVPRGKAIR